MVKDDIKKIKLVWPGKHDGHGKPTGVIIAKKFGWHARFPIPYEEAHQEIKELMEIKHVALAKNKES